MTLISGIKEEVLIQIDKKQIEVSPGRNFLGLISTSPALAQDKFKYEQVTRYQSVCPNCGDGKELFCSSYPNKKIVEENSEVYAYIPGSICD